MPEVEVLDAGNDLEFSPTPASIIPPGHALKLFVETVPHLNLTGNSQDLPPAERRDFVRGIIKKSLDCGDKLYLLSGELLYECDKNQYWRVWTYTNEDGENVPYLSFEDYTERELKIRYRKAKYLIQIYEKFVIELGLSKEELKDVEWSKAKEFVRVIAKNNYKELLARIPSMSMKECIELAKVMKHGGNVPHEKDRAVNFSFRLYPEQLDNVKRALEIAGKLSGSDKPGAQLDFICSDFIAGAPESSGVDAVLENLQKVISSIERAYKVKLTVSQVDESHYEKMVGSN